MIHFLWFAGGILAGLIIGGIAVYYATCYAIGRGLNWLADSAA